MTKDDPIYKVIKEFEKYKDDKDDIEMLNDINTIDAMIWKIIPYDAKVINDIEKKYSNEINVLISIKHKIFGISKFANKTITPNQYLLDLQHTLVRVQIMRVLNRKGKKMLEEDLVNNDNEYLYNKFVEVMKES